MPVTLLAAAPAADASTELDDPAEPLIPRKPKTQKDRDKIEALSLFASGRAEEQRGNLAAALRLYQRALRYEPDSLPIVREVIAAAQKLERVRDVVNYTIRALELDPSDPRLGAIAEQLARQGDVDGALKLYEKARHVQRNTKSAAYLLFTMQYGQLSYLENHAKQAANAFHEVTVALAEPDAYSLNAKQRRTLEGEDGENYQVFGQAFLAADRSDEARRAFERMQEISPDKAIYAFNQAQVLAHEKKYAEALEHLREYLNSDETPATDAPYVLLANILKELDRSGELLPELAKLYADDSSNAALKLYLADQYLAADKPADAEPLFAALQKKTPSLQGYRGLLEAYTALDQPEKAVELLAEVHEKTNGLEIVSEQVKKIGKQPQVLDRLVETARRMTKSSKTTTAYNASMAVGLVALDAKRFELADEMFEQAIQTKPRSREAWLEWGLGLLRAEKYAEAATVFRRAIDSHVLAADNPAFHTYLAMALAMDKKTDEALATAREAAEIGEHSARLESRVAWVHYHAKQYPEAQTAYRELIDKFDDDYKSDEVRSVLREARLALSNLCVLQDKIPEAEEWLEQVLDEYPDDTSALNDLGYLWADQGKHLERALTMVEQAVDAEPDNTAYRDSLGWVYYRLKRYPEAVEQLEKATADESPDGVILEHLGDAYMANKQRAKARETWKRAVAAMKKAGEKDKAAKVEKKLKK
ncbi:MAG TPA: tetratricopeptide repeat protein [Pirellulales bacterium]|jgi:tetratricopeptide (TPR) repeat protein|nr:tetratricopeptide repeat protein [Pirellulales bacterium]